jgi:protease-4
MIELVGESADDDTDYSSIDYRSYLDATRHAQPPKLSQDNVGVIVASGQIVDGDAEPGEVGGDSLADLIHQAAIDDSIKAVVLRVDSPGGSMFASEVIYDEIQALKDTGKPFVVSMGTLAASGGYYISVLADEIWAEESTITGSIGVGALVPTVNRGLGALGIHVDGIGTTKLAGQLRIDRPLGDDARQLLQQTVDDAYRIFVSKVAEGRKMSFEQADQIARGRVWIGTDAKRLGLVDEIGDLPGAIQSAAGRAGLEAGSYGIQNVEPELSIPQQILRDYAARVVVNLDRMGVHLPSPLRRLLASGERELRALAAFNDPRGLYSLCSCVMP